MIFYRSPCKNKIGSLLRRSWLVALEKKYDAKFRVAFDAIRELMEPPVKAKRRIGFRRDPE